jgi:hypothetical protein
MALKTKTKFAPDEVVVAHQALAAGDDVVLRGEERRGSDPTVQAFPEAFVPQGTPSSEWPSPWDGEVAEHAPEFTQPPRPTVFIPDVVQCATAFQVLADGRTIGRGTVLHVDDPLVRRFADYFVPLEVPDPAA